MLSLNIALENRTNINSKIDWVLFFNNPIFYDQPAHMIRRAVFDSRCCQYQSGESMISQGQPACSFHLILSGKAMVYRESPKCGRTVLRTAEVGDVLGLPAACGQGVFQYTVMSITDVRSQVFPRNVVAYLLANSSSHTNNILRLITADADSSESWKAYAG